MTPRSVQIWFQNRRQRLLKPQMRGDEGDGGELLEMDDESGEGAAGAGALAGLVAHGQRAAAQQRAAAAAAAAAAQANSGNSGGPPPSSSMGMEYGRQPPMGGEQRPLPPHLQSGGPSSSSSSAQPPQGPHTGGGGYPAQSSSSTAQQQPQGPSQQQPQGPINMPPQHPYPVGAGLGGGPVTAAHLIAAGVAGGNNAAAQAQGGGASGPAGLSAAMSLPILVSRLGSLMMGTACPPDLALGGLPHALAMLPQAVAAGHVSPGAAALLMQALQAQMGHLEMAAAAAGAPATADQSQNNAGNSPAWPPQQGQWPNTAQQQQQPPPPHPYGVEQHGSSGPSPLASPRGQPLPLPSYLNPDIPQSSQQQQHAQQLLQQQAAAAGLMQQGLFGGGQVGQQQPGYPQQGQQQQQPGPQQHDTQGAPPGGGGGGVDALLLLSACADVQQKEEEEDPAPQKPPGLEVVAEQGVDDRPRSKSASSPTASTASSGHGYGLPLGQRLQPVLPPPATTGCAPGQGPILTAVHDRMPSVDHGHDGSVLSGITKEMPQAQGYPVERTDSDESRESNTQPKSMGSIDSTLSSVQLSLSTVSSEVSLQKGVVVQGVQAVGSSTEQLLMAPPSEGVGLSRKRPLEAMESAETLPGDQEGGGGGGGGMVEEAYPVASAQIEPRVA